jgi:hypothetical protein
MCAIKNAIHAVARGIKSPVFERGSMRIALVVHLLLVSSCLAQSATNTTAATTPAPDPGTIVVRFNMYVPSCSSAINGTNCSADSDKNVLVSRRDASSGTASTELWVIIVIIALGVMVLALGIVAIIALVRTQQVAPYTPLPDGGGYVYPAQQASGKPRRVISVELVKPCLPEETVMA